MMDHHTHDGARLGSLQDETARDPAERGVIVQTPGGMAGVLAIPGAVLRLERGTWAIRVARLEVGPIGHQVAAGPGVGNPTFPYLLIIRHGQGAAVWNEILPVVARGTLVVRCADYMQCELWTQQQVGELGDTLLVVACQLIVPIHPSDVTTQATAVVAGLGIASVHNVPPWARRVQYAGPAFADLAWYDAAGNSLNALGAPPLPGSWLVVPALATQVSLGGGVAGDLSVMTWEVWG